MNKEEYVLYSLLLISNITLVFQTPSLKKAIKFMWHLGEQLT